jgi:hypothetical protein
VRARGEVLAFKADVDNMNRLLALHPELEAALKDIAGMWLAWRTKSSQSLVIS